MSAPYTNCWPPFYVTSSSYPSLSSVLIVTNLCPVMIFCRNPPWASFPIISVGNGHDEAERRKLFNTDEITSHYFSLCFLKNESREPLFSSLRPEYKTDRTHKQRWIDHVVLEHDTNMMGMYGDLVPARCVTKTDIISKVWRRWFKTVFVHTVLSRRWFVPQHTSIQLLRFPVRFGILFKKTNCFLSCIMLYFNSRMSASTKPIRHFNQC